LWEDRGWLPRLVVVKERRRPRGAPEGEGDMEEREELNLQDDSLDVELHHRRHRDEEVEPEEDQDVEAHHRRHRDEDEEDDDNDVEAHHRRH
jgi:hypothetical protein